MKKILIIAIFIFLVSGVVWKIGPSSSTDFNIETFSDCIAAGNPAMESYPRQCRTEGGQLFVEDIGNELDEIDSIRIDGPRPNSVIRSPLTVTGEARGFWFFEADFSVRLFDDNGNEIATGIARASGDWMTEDFVPFSVEISFESPVSGGGILVLEKDNPSDLPENDGALIVPVLFEKVSSQSDCRPTGCSGQVCDDEEVITTCEFRPGDECLVNAVCERQPEGDCGWTENPELLACFVEAMNQ